MKKTVTTAISLLPTIQLFAQNTPTLETKLKEMEALSEETPIQFIFPILFMSFLIVMLITLVKYFLEFRLKSKLIDKGMAEQLSNYLVEKNEQEKQNEAIKLAILFCGIGLGLLFTYFSAPLNIHSIAIMSLSLGLIYWAYFLYLKKKNN